MALAAPACGDDVQYPLHRAVIRGDLNSLFKAINNGASVNQRDGLGRTPLMTAIAAHRQDCVRALLKWGADVAERDRKGLTALHWTALTGATAAARELLTRHANVNTLDKLDRTPLLYAVAQQHTALVELLLHYGAAPLAEDPISAMTTLEIASEQNNRAILALLEKRSTPNLANGGFEQPTLQNGALSSSLPGWTQFGNGTAAAYHVAEGKRPRPSQGANVCLVWGETGTNPLQHTIIQTVDVPSLTKPFIMHFDVGHPKGRLFRNQPYRWQSSSATLRIFFTTDLDVKASKRIGQQVEIPLTMIRPGEFLKNQQISLPTLDSLAGRSSTLHIAFSLVAPDSRTTDMVGVFIDNIRITQISQK